MRSRAPWVCLLAAAALLGCGRTTHTGGGAASTTGSVSPSVVATGFAGTGTASAGGPSGRAATTPTAPPTNTAGPTRNVARHTSCQPNGWDAEPAGGWDRGRGHGVRGPNVPGRADRQSLPAATGGGRDRRAGRGGG